MMVQHAQKRTHRDARIYIPKRSILLTLGNVTADKLINALYEFVKEPLGQLMFLERRIKEQTHKSNILLMFVQRIEGDVVKHADIVLFGDGVFQRFVFLPGKPPNTVLAPLG